MSDSNQMFDRLIAECDAAATKRSLLQPNWTDERPTEPGEYWLSLHPSMRASLAKELRMTPPPTLEVYGFGIGSIIAEFWWGENAIDDEFLDGALWAERTTPDDPFAKPETMRTDHEGREYNHDDREQKLNPDALVKKAIQNLRRHKPKNGRGYVYPLWKRVADLFGHGSGYSAEICRRNGFDPDEQWKPEEPVKEVGT